MTDWFEQMPSAGATAAEQLIWIARIQRQLEREIAAEEKAAALAQARTNFDALAKEAALRVFAHTHPVGDPSRAQSFAAMSIVAGEAFAQLWTARERER